MHHGRGVEAARRRRRRRPPAARPPRAPPHAHAPSPQPRRLRPCRMWGGRPRAWKAPAAEAQTAATHAAVRHFRGGRPRGAAGTLARRRGRNGRHLAAPRGRPHAPNPPAPLGSVLTWDNGPKSRVKRLLFFGGIFKEGCGYLEQKYPRRPGP